MMSKIALNCISWVNVTEEEEEEEENGDESDKHI